MMRLKKPIIWHFGRQKKGSILRNGRFGLLICCSKRKYVGITGTSRATASRDLQELVSMQVFIPAGAGRSARFALFFYCNACLLRMKFSKICAFCALLRVSL